jgi:hypothetical protein
MLPPCQQEEFEMEQKQLEALRAQYPEKYYSIAETGGKLTVKPRTIVLWFPKRFSNEIATLSPEQLSLYIENLLEKIKLTREHFMPVQKVITKHCAEKIIAARKEMHCKKTELIAALFQGRAARNSRHINSIQD